MRLSWLLLSLLAIRSVAAQDFTPALVLVAHTYVRHTIDASNGSLDVSGATVDANIVTVALDGYDVTGTFDSKTDSSPRAWELRIATTIPAAIRRGRLLLRWPDGTVVDAEIVRREKHKQRATGQERD